MRERRWFRATTSKRAKQIKKNADYWKRVIKFAEWYMDRLLLVERKKIELPILEIRALMTKKLK